MNSVNKMMNQCVSEIQFLLEVKNTVNRRYFSIYKQTRNMFPVQCIAKLLQIEIVSKIS